MAFESDQMKYVGQRLKLIRDNSVGTMMSMRLGWDEKEVEVLALSDQRRGAPEAQRLYRETEESIQKREQRAAERHVMHRLEPFPARRPTKKQRRQIHRFRQQDLD